MLSQLGAGTSPKMMSAASVKFTLMAPVPPANTPATTAASVSLIAAPYSPSVFISPSVGIDR